MYQFLTSWGNGLCNWGGSGYGPGGGWHMPFMGGPFMLVLLVLAGIFVMQVFKRRSLSHDAERESPKDVLRRRYASGEIDKASYESMCKDIS